VLIHCAHALYSHTVLVHYAHALYSQQLTEPLQTSPHAVVPRGYVVRGGFRIPWHQNDYVEATAAASKQGGQDPGDG
jgi:hypothetical protein